MSRLIQSKEGVPITLPEGLAEDQLWSFKPFTTWMSTLSRSLALQSSADHPFRADPYALRSVTVQAFDLFGSSRVGFVKLAAVVSNRAGETLPAAALLRGPSVAMLVMLIPDDAAPDSDERYVVFTVQPRVPAGSLGFVELPAGMVDDSGHFKGVAAQEIQEELGITIAEDELQCLSDLAAEDEQEKTGEVEGLAAAMFPSAGGCDEHVTIYSHERRIPRSELQSWSGRLTGLRDRGEKITLRIVPMREAWKAGARDAKALGALALWEGLRREGKLELLRQEHALGQRPDAGLLAEVPEVLERVGKDLDELVVLELGLRVLVLGRGDVDGDVHHAQVGVAEARVVEHDGRRLGDDADVARLLAQLAQGGLLGRLAGVDEARGDLERHAVNGRAVLALQHNVLGAGGGVVEDGDDADAVNGARGGALATLG
ncbi:Nudix hydrolase 14, chloroplastic [Beauveria bassiana]|nr:Nudix hydrolase 14, chloroplastic [Beauveria bassiana]